MEEDDNYIHELTTNPPTETTPTLSAKEPERTNPYPPEPTPTSPSGPDTSAPVEKRTHKKLFNGLNRESAEYFMDSLSMLILSGVTVGDALQSISQELTNKKVKKAVLAMQARIDEGMPFAEALDQTGLFPPSVITLVDVGQTSGRLAENLKVIAEQMHKNNLMNSKIRSAMLYPAFLIVMLFIVGTGIGVFLLPRLLTVIKSLNENVGPITRALFVLGGFFGHWGLIIAGAVLVLIMAAVLAAKLNPNFKAFTEVILFHVPGVKRLFFETEVSRFGFVLGTLLEAGLPIVNALQSLSGSMSTRRYQVFTSELATRINEGNSFERILVEPKARALLAGSTCQIIISAEKSGNLSKSLLRVGENYQEKADITARNLETLIEPVVLVIIAAGVLFVALAVFLPIYSVVGNFNANG